MKQYIDAEKLIAKIERLKDKYPSWQLKLAMDDLKEFISSLQQEQPEVDLEKEYKTWWNSISGKINVEHMMEWYMHETARHFYELGLNARKENGK